MKRRIELSGAAQQDHSNHSILSAKHLYRRRACFSAIGILLLMLAAPLRAALLSHDGFAYSLNSSLPGQNGGEGFAGAWLAGVNAGVTGSRFVVASPTLTYPGLATNGARLRVTSGTAQGARRALAQQMGASGTVRYVSLLVRPDATPSPSSYFGLQLIGSAGADLFAGKPGGGATGKYVLENAGGAGQVATTRDVVANAVVLLVLRLEFNAGNDHISLYINPIMGAAEPAVPDAVKTDLDLGATIVPALIGTAAWSVDELRTGTAFASVLPPAPDFQLAAIPSGSATEHLLVTRQVLTVDPLPPGRTLTFELVGDAFGAAIDPVTGAFTWVPGELDGGQMRNFLVRATSNASPPASATVSFSLNVTEVNSPPQLAEILDQSVKEGSEFTYELGATDSDEPRQNISYAVQSGPPGLTVSSGQLYWRPTWAQRGRSYPVTVLAGDTMSGRTSRSFTITVQARNHFTARWTGGASGAWDVPGNWEIGQVPQNTVDDVFDVVLNSDIPPATIHIPNDVTIHDLIWFSGGSIELQSPSVNLTVEGSFVWAGGAVGGPGQMTVHGRATIGGNQGGPLTLRNEARLALKANSELSTPLRCEGNVRLMVEPTAILGVPQYGGFVRVGGVPEIINDGSISIWGQLQPIPFIYLYNRGSVFAFTSILDFDTGAILDLLQETGGHLNIGAGLNHGAILDAQALIRPGSTVTGQGYIRAARIEGQIQGRISFEELEFGPTAVSRFSLAGTHDQLNIAQPVALAGQLEIQPGPGFDPDPDAVYPLVVSQGDVTGEFVGRPFGQRVQIPGTGQSLLLTRSADSRQVRLSRYLPPAVSLSVTPLSFRMVEVGGGLGGCFVVPDPAVVLPETNVAGSTLTVAITDGYDAAVDRLEFRLNPAFPEADEITLEGPAGGVQTVRFRGTNFGTLQLNGGFMTCDLNAQADNESVVALLGRLYYGNTECTGHWWTNATMQYPQRTIVVTLTETLGAVYEVSRFVNFPFLWGIRLPESLALTNGQTATLHLRGWFSTDQVLLVPALATEWSESCSNASVLVPPISMNGQQGVIGREAPYCCRVTARSGALSAATTFQDSLTEVIPYEELGPIQQMLIYNLLGGTNAYESKILEGVSRGGCPLGYGMYTTERSVACYTTPGFSAASHTANIGQSLTPIYTLEALMKRTPAGQRWVDLYWLHGPEVISLFIQHPSLLFQAQDLVVAFQPGVTALLAGRGDTVPIYVPMITRVNDFWNALAEHASPALKTVLQQEQARFDNFRMFQNRTFNEWAGLLGIHIPFQPYLHISLMRREADKFHLALNDVPGMDLSLWRSIDLVTWTRVTNAEIQRDGTTFIFTDPAPPVGQAFYAVRQ